MQKVVKFEIKEKQSSFEKTREKYKKDFKSFIEKKTQTDGTIRFRNYDNRERM